jgi:hypothetical protein
VQDTLPAPTLPVSAETLTAENNQDLAALLAGPGPGSCDKSWAEFATKYKGRNIKFDGFIAFMHRHGDYTTRFDFLIFVGDYHNDPPFIGPSFIFEDKNYYDLGLMGLNIPDSVQANDNLTFVATVDEYVAEACSVRLVPVSTQAR